MGKVFTGDKAFFIFEATSVGHILRVCGQLIVFVLSTAGRRDITFV